MNPWKPETDPVVIRRMGKSSEELSELIEAASRLLKAMQRVIIQGKEGIDPHTNEMNLQALEKESADVMAQIMTTIDVMELNLPNIRTRMLIKCYQMAEWERLVAGTETLQREQTAEYALVKLTQALEKTNWTVWQDTSRFNKELGYAIAMIKSKDLVAANVVLPPRCSVCKDTYEGCSKNYSGGWVGTKCPN